MQAAPEEGGVDIRWIGSGKTVYNNKGNVVMQYEPYFSTTPLYDGAEQAAMLGVTARLHYDPLGRVRRTHLPDGSYTKTEFDAWQQLSYDNNDTVALPMAGGTTLYSDWYLAYSTGTPEQQDTAAKALEHANTPTTVHLDTLARPFYTIQHNRTPVSGVWTDAYYASYVVLDINGNRMEMHDARSNTPLSYHYNMVNGVVKQVSIDSGMQLIANDVDDQPLYNWDADSRLFHFAYDGFRRLLSKDVTPSGGATKLLGGFTYGETASDPKTYNLRGRVYIIYDGAGTQTLATYDLDGNLLNNTRQYVEDYTQAPDWSASPSLEGDTYTTSMTYDALGRPLIITTPDAGETIYTYEQTGLLYSG